MKQYVIDELRLADYSKLKVYLDSNYDGPALEGVYAVSLDKEILNEIQAAHLECGPFYFALELTEKALCCELLVRASNRMRCNCVAYADQRQRNWLIDVMNAVFEKLDLKA